MELNLPDFERLDHRQHAAAGAVTALGTSIMLDLVVPDAPKWVRITVPIAASVLVGFGKECLDAQDTENHCVELGDALATGAGGAAMTIAYTWTF